MVLSLVVSSCGLDAANGAYIATGRTMFGAQVFENDKKFILSREPHSNSKTGGTSYGWIIGKDKKAYYGVMSSEMTPPVTGWMKFGGTFPIPVVETATSAAEAAATAAEMFKEDGKMLFQERRFADADAKWTRALDVPDLTDGDMVVALYSNRAEAKLRQFKWQAALDDALAALSLKPNHDKALLRAAVACREMKDYSQSMVHVETCLNEYPKHIEASELLLELENLKQADNKAMANKVLKSAKVQSDWLAQQDGSQKCLSEKEIIGTKSVEAFKGYGKNRDTDVEEPLVSALPYHKAGLPQDRVDVADKALEDLRAMRDEKRHKAKEATEVYPRLKKEYKDRATENQHMGKLEPLESILPVEAAKMKALADQAEAAALALAETSAAVVSLAPEDTAQIDAMFASMDSSRPSATPTGAGGSRFKEKLRKAKLAVA